jgi:hypothetical protein
MQISNLSRFVQLQNNLLFTIDASPDNGAQLLIEGLGPVQINDQDVDIN